MKSKQLVQLMERRIRKSLRLLKSLGEWKTSAEGYYLSITMATYQQLKINA